MQQTGAPHFGFQKSCSLSVHQLYIAEEYPLSACTFSTPAAFCSAHVIHAMLPTSPLTAARILSWEELPRAYASKTVFGKGAPTVHEPQLPRIADLFLANRHPQSFSWSSREDPSNKTWLQQIGRNHNFPKLFRHAQEIRIHKPRIFKRFPLKHKRITKSSTSAAASATQALRKLSRFTLVHAELRRASFST